MLNVWWEPLKACLSYSLESGDRLGAQLLLVGVVGVIVWKVEVSPSWLICAVNVSTPCNNHTCLLGLVRVIMCPDA